jgi:hypothetical protein
MKTILASLSLAFLWCACAKDSAPPVTVTTRTIGIPNNAPNQFYQIHATGADADGNLYVTDAHKRIVTLGTNGDYLGEVSFDVVASSLDVTDRIFHRPPSGRKTIDPRGREKVRNW